METNNLTQEDFLKAWQQTGLLEGSSSPHSLAHLLDAAAQTLIEARQKLEKEEAEYIAKTIFPVIVRSTNKINFTTEIFDSDTIETVKIQKVEEDNLLEECVRTGSELSAKLSKYNNLNVSKVRISTFDNGYYIGLDCNSNA